MAPAAQAVGLLHRRLQQVHMDRHAAERVGPLAHPAQEIVRGAVGPRWRKQHPGIPPVVARVEVVEEGEVLVDDLPLVEPDQRRRPGLQVRRQRGEESLLVQGQPALVPDRRRERQTDARWTGRCGWPSRPAARRPVRRRRSRCGAATCSRCRMCRSAHSAAVSSGGRSGITAQSNRAFSRKSVGTPFWMGERPRPWQWASARPGSRRWLPSPTTRARGCLPARSAKDPVAATRSPSISTPPSRMRPSVLQARIREKILPAEQELPRRTLFGRHGYTPSISAMTRGTSPCGQRTGRPHSVRIRRAASGGNPMQSRTISSRPGSAKSLGGPGQRRRVERGGHRHRGMESFLAPVGRGRGHLPVIGRDHADAIPAADPPGHRREDARRVDHGDRAVQVREVARAHEGGDRGPLGRHLAGSPVQEGLEPVEGDLADGAVPQDDKQRVLAARSSQRVNLRRLDVVQPAPDQEIRVWQVPPKDLFQVRPRRLSQCDDPDRVHIPIPHFRGRSKRSRC